MQRIFFRKSRRMFSLTNSSVGSIRPPVSYADIPPEGGLILWTKVKFYLFAENSPPPSPSRSRYGGARQGECPKSLPRFAGARGLHRTAANPPLTPPRRGTKKSAPFMGVGRQTLEGGLVGKRKARRSDGLLNFNENNIILF